jgi:hypothetical protein
MLMTAIALGIAAAGAITQAVGAVKSGNAAKKSGEAVQAADESVAQLDEYNAAVADLQAKDSVERGAFEEQRFRQGVRVMIGSQRAGIAASNVDVGFGSAVDVQADAAFLGELDALTIRTNAQREAYGYTVQGEDLRKRAEISRKEGAAGLAAGEAAQSQSRWQAAGSVLNTGTSLLQARYGFKK